MRIYVACLSAYNAGHLHGVWIDVTDDVESMVEEISHMLKVSPSQPAEEWAIHGHEGFGKLVGEQTPLEYIAGLGQLMDGFGEGAVLAFAEYFCSSLSLETLSLISGSFNEGAYLGAYHSLEAYVEEVMGDEVEARLGDLAYYFDYERYTRDLQLSGDIVVLDSEEAYGVYIFNNYAIDHDPNYDSYLEALREAKQRAISLYIQECEEALYA